MSKKELVALVDLDRCKYAIAYVGEEKTIEVTFPNGVVKPFKNKTEFYGKTKLPGGWLKDQYDLLGVPDEHRRKDQFTFVEKQTLKEELSHILHSAKVNIEAQNAAIGATRAEYFIGEGDSFRVERSTIQKYKGGTRETNLKPLALGDVVVYLKNKFKPEVVTGIENDDRLVMRYLELEKQGIRAVLIAEDKDTYSCPVLMYNPERPEEGIVDCRGFGKLWIVEKKDPETGKIKSKDVRGVGRLYKYQQICSLDKVDNYSCYAASDASWGEMSAYNALKDCKDDKEAWQTIVDIYKKLYPEPKEWLTWKGETVTIDWMYVLQELVDLVHMHRWEGDLLNVKDILNRLEICVD